MKNLLDIIEKHYKLTELGAKGFDGMKVKGMTFSINSYNAEGLGHVSTMCASGFLGFMKMDTLIINPTELDLPLLSYDRIFAFGVEKLIAEVYDTMLERRPLPTLAEFNKTYSRYVTPTSQKGNWYDDIRMSDECVSLAGKKDDNPEFDKMIVDYLKAYLALPADKVTDIAAKKAKNDIYVNGLLENGGIATDLFIKKNGKENTSMLFKEVLFSHS